MRPTGSQESVSTRRASKRNRGVTSTAAATLGVTTRSRARAQQESQPVARTKTGEGEKKVAKIDAVSRRVSPKRARAKTGEGEKKVPKIDGISRRVSPKKAKEKKMVKTDGCSKSAKIDGNGISQPESSKKGKSILEHSQNSLSWGEDDDDEDDYDDDDDYGWTDSSSALSSPIRVPEPLDFRPHDPNGDSEVDKKKRAMSHAFFQKLDRQNQLPTLFPGMPLNCLVDDPTFLHIREPARKMVLRAAQFVVGLSSSIDGVPLARYTGFWIDFDKANKTGTVVTTARIICTRNRSSNAWFCRDQYNCDAKVNVDLRGYKGYNIIEGNLLYYHKHYNLAFFSARVNRFVQLPSFNDNVKCAQDIFELGRDEYYNLLIYHGKVEYSNPTGDERYHHMYIQDAERDPQRDRLYDIGGPVIDLDGKVVGMIGSCARRSFIPSSVLLKCIHLWRKFQRIRRPHLGLKFNAIRFLNPAHVEKIFIECGIDEGLVVDEVSGNCPAEECGFRIGDVIERINGKRISTTVELENMLLSIMENIGDDFNSDLDLEIQVYFTRKDVRRTKVLTVNLSEDGEYCVSCCLTPTPLVT